MSFWGIIPDCSTNLFVYMEDCISMNELVYDQINNGEKI